MSIAEDKVLLADPLDNAFAEPSVANLRAARVAVCSRARDAADAVRLLDMLGLVGGDDL